MCNTDERHFYNCFWWSHMCSVTTVLISGLISERQGHNDTCYYGLLNTFQNMQVHVNYGL